MKRIIYGLVLCIFLSGITLNAADRFSQGGEGPDIALDPGSKNFGEVAVGSDASHTFIVSNEGQSDLNVSEVKFLHEDADQFRIDSGGGSFTLAPGGSREVVVSFVPTSSGSKFTHLKFYSNDPDENPKWAELSGKGIGQDPDIALEPGSKNFGEVAVGSDASHTFIVSNEGQSDLNVSEVKFLGGNADQFRIDIGGGSFTLAPGAIREVVVGFVPTSSGCKSTHLKFYSNDPDENPKCAELSGKGIGQDPDIALEPGSKNFGEVAVGSDASHTFIVSNAGQSDLNVSEVKFLHEDTDQFRIDSGGGSFTLASGASREVVVSFVPTSSGSKMTHLKFYSNDPDENPKWADLSGEGIGQDPDIALDPGSKNFGEVAVGSDASHTFIVSNEGQSDLKVSELKFLGGNADQFRIDSGGGSFTLAPGASREVVVGFVPTSSGCKSTHLKFYSNDPDENPKWANLSGKGIGAGVDPDIALDSGSKDFGEVTVGSSASHSFTVSNKGHSDLHVSEVKLIGGNPDQFRIDSGGGSFTLAPGANHEVMISFVPTASGPLGSHLKFYSNDPDENPAYVDLLGTGTGTGAEPDIALDPASHDYGDVSVGSSVAYSYSVYNEGEYDLHVSEVKLVGGNPDQFRIDSGGGSFTLAPGVSRQVVVSFIPTSGGSKSTHLKFYSNDPDENPKWADLEGQAPDTQPPVITYCYPAANSHNVPKNTKIQFELKDFEIASNINVSSLDVCVNGEMIISKGDLLTGHQVEIFWCSKRLKVVYDPPTDFEEGSTVTVNIQCRDLASPPNSMNVTYSFTVCQSTTTVTSTNTVAQNGGVVSCNTTNIEITIPSGALEDTTEITIAGVDEVPELPDNVKGIGLKYHFGPDGLQFNNTVTIRIPFTQEDLALAGVKNPLELEIYYYHTSTGEWVQLEIIDENDQYIYVQVDQFCYLNIAKSGVTGVNQNQQQIVPEDNLLEQNYPNPFNPETHISFQVPAPNNIQIEIYNSAGQKIRTLVDETMSIGRYDVIWDGRDDYGQTVSSGMYFYAMRSEGFKQIRRMVFTK